MRVRLFSAVLCTAVVVTSPAHVWANEPDPDPVSSLVGDVPVHDLTAMPPPAESPAVHLPPPAPAPADAPSSPAQGPAEVEVPTEGWTVTSHWKSNGDGTVRGEFYTGPEFRPVGSGWERIDPALVTRPDGTVASPGSLVPVVLGTTPATLAAFTLPGGVVTQSALTLPGLPSSLVPSIEGGQVEYGLPALDAGFSVDVGFGGVKTNIVLESEDAPRTWRFRLADPLGALGDVVALDHDAYRFSEEVAPDTYAELAAPYAYEAGGDPLAVELGSAHQTVTKTLGGFDVTLSVDEEWLEGKTFPIVLDPTFRWVNGAVSSYVQSKKSPGNTACGLGGGGCIGYIPPQSNPNALGAATQTEIVGTTYKIDARPARSYYRSDLSRIPGGSVINNAELRLYQNGCFGYDSAQYECDERSYTEQHFIVEEGNRSTALSHTNTYDEHAAATGPVMNSTVIPPIAPGTRAPISFPLKDHVEYYMAFARYFPDSYVVGQKLSSEPAYPTNIGGPSFSGPNDPTYPHPEIYVDWTPPPGAPGSVAASKVAMQSVRVTYTAASTNGGPAITGYTTRLYKPNGTVQATKTCVSCTSQQFDNLPYGTYYAKVQATNGVVNGPESVKSNDVTLTPAPILAKTAIPALSAYARGQEITFRLRVSNPDLTAAMPVTKVTDTLPSLLTTAVSTVTIGGAACSGCTLNGATLETGSFSVPAGGFTDVVYRAIARGAERVCDTVTNAATAVNSLGSSSASIPVTICDGALGLEAWWTYVATALGPESSSRVNVANGNLVVQATDGVPVQARGRLAFVQRRTYNSQDVGALTLPGSIGGGWHLNLGETGDLAGAGVTGSGLYVPSVSAAANPLAVTLIDRDGTRHVFWPRALSTPISLASLTGSTAATAALVPAALPTTGFTSVCVDAVYDAPPGVELALWRYVGVASASCSDTAAARTVIGFATERPDRLRQEFSWNGKLLSLTDGNGVSLRYVYESAISATVDPGRLRYVYEPRSCSSAPTSGSSLLAASCRALRVTYPSATEVQVSDSTGGVTRYLLDGATPVQHLVAVVNPPEVAGEVVSDRWTMTYHGFGGATCGGAAGQLCSVKDPRGNTTYYTYAAATIGLPKIATVKDRGNVVTSFSYYKDAASDYVTADTSGHRERYVGIDDRGRVREVDSGTTGDVYQHQVFTVWDADVSATTASTCRRGTTGVQNDLCRVVRRAVPSTSPLSETPVAGDEDTRYIYNAEGELIVEERANPGKTPATLWTTYGHKAQYVGGTGTTVATDTVAGSGTVTSSARPSSADVLYVLTDRTQSLPPRGNAAGANVVSFLTTYTVAASTTRNPHYFGSSTCDSRNNGLACTVAVPHSATSRATTTYDYDEYGQRTRMTRPENTYGSSYTYTYFGDSDRDVSGVVTTAGWLRAVTDPAGAFVAFAYDRAGHVTRTWDRNQTKGFAVTSFPGVTELPPDPEYAETVYGSAARPWRYATSVRDPLGNRVTLTYNRNGYLATERSARGYDTTFDYDADDNLTYVLRPEERTANKPSTSKYDDFGNLEWTVDPNGNATTFDYDSVQRLKTVTFTRGTDLSHVPTGCRPSSAADAPIPLDRIVCSESYTYDSVDNVLSTTDASTQVTYHQYDSLHRRVSTQSPRHDGTYTTLRTDVVYDENGNPTDVCPPREFASGSAACTATGVYSAHTAYDPADRPVSVTTYRAAGQPFTATTAYDRNGNVVRAVDENGRATERVHDTLDRLVSVTVPRAAGVVNTTGFEYDAVGNRTAVIEPEDLDFGTGADGDLVVDGTVNGYYNPYVVPEGRSYRNVTLVNGGHIGAAPMRTGGSGRVTIKATGTLSVCNSCGILAYGAGHPGGDGSASLTAAGADGAGPGPGRGGKSATENGGGGGAGGGRQGTAASGTAGPQGALPDSGGAGGAGGTVYGGADITSYGTAQDLGSGGGGGGRGGLGNGGGGGAGGGAVRIVAARVVLDSGINASGDSGGAGQAGTNNVGKGGAGGGGGGGTIWLTTQALHRSSGFSVYGGGGMGGSAYGADGAIRIDTAVETGRRFAHSVPASYHWLGRVTAFSYDANNRLLDTVTGSGSRSASAAGVVSADGGSNSRTSLGYDPDGNVVARLEARAFAASTARPATTSFMTRYDYDGNGRLLAQYSPRFDNGTPDLTPASAQSAECATTHRPVAWAGVPSYPGDTAVCRTKHAYDFAGNHVRTWLPTSNGADNRYVAMTYTADNLLANVTTPDPAQPTSATARAAASTYLHDGVGRVHKSTDALTHYRLFEYTSDGLLKKQTNQPNGSNTHVWSYGYDANGHQVSTQHPNTRTSSTAYFADGRVQSTTDTGGYTTSYTYDGVGNPLTVMSPAANARVAPNTSGTPVTYTYTHDNLLLTSTEPVTGSSSRRTTYAYDAVGRKTGVTVDRTGTGAASGGTQQFSYYANGLLRTETGRAGDTSTTTTYDPAGRPKAVTTTPPSGSAVTTTMAYYLDGLLKSATQSGRTTSYAYNGGGALALRDELAGTAHTRTTYTWGNSGHQDTSTSDLTGLTRWTHDSAGRPVTQVNPNGTTVTRVYNDDDTLLTQTLAPTGAGTPALAAWRYDYDQLYRVTLAALDAPSTATCAAPIPAGVHCYGYDNAGRLNRFADSALDRTVKYDANGNREEYGAQRFIYNADNSIASATDANGANSKTYGYDPAGRLTGDGASTYCYDGLDRLVSVRTGNGVACTGTATNGLDYAYDGLDRQVRRTEAGTGSAVPGTTVLHYDGTSSGVLAEAEPNATNAYVLAGSSPLAVVRTGTGAVTQLLTGDGRGNVSTATTTGTPAQVGCRIRYTPFDAPFGAQSGSNPCFSGSTPARVLSGAARRDPSTGQYQLGSRTYDPEKAAFLTPDTYRSSPSAADLGVGVDPLTANRYGYVNGDPVNLVDPTGHAAIDPTGGKSRGELEWDCMHSVRNQAQSNSEADRLEAECYARFDILEPESFGDGMKRVGKTVGPTVAGMVVGGGCLVVTGGAGSVGCAAAGGAVSGALTGVRDCGDAENYAKCVATYTAVDTVVAAGTAGLGKGAGALRSRFAKEIGGGAVESTAGRTVVKPKPKAKPPTGTQGGRASTPAKSAGGGTPTPGGGESVDSVMLDAGTARAIAADPDSHVRTRLLAQIGDRAMVMTRTGAAEFRDAVARLAGPMEKASADNLLARVTVVGDNPSARAAVLKATRRLDANDIQIFGTADRMGIQVFTSDLKALKAADAQGVTFDAIVHPSRSFKGF